MQGKFISFEGCEGSGKSTQAEKLAEYFINNNRKVLLTKEPGGTDVADILRNILITGKTNKIEKPTELLLYYAARIEHLHKKILPALKNNQIVICDRFSDSTVAYQGYGHNINFDLINFFEKNFTFNIKPDITFLLDADVKLTLARTLERNNISENRYENMDISFHQNVRKGFLAIAKKDPARVKIIDASKNKEEIFKKITSFCHDYLA